MSATGISLMHAGSNRAAFGPARDRPCTMHAAHGAFPYRPRVPVRAVAVAGQDSIAAHGLAHVAAHNENNARRAASEHLYNAVAQ